MYYSYIINRILTVIQWCLTMVYHQPAITYFQVGWSPPVTFCRELSQISPDIITDLMSLYLVAIARLVDDEFLGILQGQEIAIPSGYVKIAIEAMAQSK